MKSFSSILICLISGIIASVPLTHGFAQSSIQPAILTYTYHPPSEDKESWQRLNLLLSSTFIIVVKEAQIDFDTCLYIASRSLGLSRLSILAEGIDDPELFAQSQWIDRQQPDAGMRQLSKATGEKHLKLLILLGSYYAFQPHNYPKYRDSVEYFLNKAVEESKLLKEERLGRQAFCLLGKIYIQANDFKGDSIYNSLLNACEKAGDKETEARVLAYRGKYTPPTPAIFQRKITDLQQASDLYHSLNNTEGEINALTDLGYMLTVAGQQQSASEIFLKALTLAEAMDFPYTHYITDALAMVTSFQGKFGEPLRYTLQSIKVAETCRDSIGWGYFYGRLAQLYNIEDRKEEWLDIVQKSISRFVIIRDPSVYNALAEMLDYLGTRNRANEAFNLLTDISNKVNSPQSLSDQFFYNKAFATCYLDLENLEKAEMHIKKMDTLETKSEAVRGPLRRHTVESLFGFLLFKRKEYQKARMFFEKTFTNSTNADRNLNNDLNIYQWLISTDSVLGDKESEISHYKKYTQLLDSNFRATKIRQTEELQVLYETQEKENQIALLNQQAQLVKDNLKQANLIKNITIAGIVFSLIVLGLLYYQFRRNQKSNKIILEKSKQLEDMLAEKEWWLKEVHHRVKNNLHTIICLLESQAMFLEKDALQAIEKSQHRIYAMSLIHQKLYQNEDVRSIDMSLYLEEFIGYLKDSFGTENIQFITEVDPIQLNLQQAIPVSLIINESVTNSIKYAFNNDADATIRVTMKQADNLISLVIADNGKGFEVKEKTNSLGLQLIQGLTKELRGTLQIETQTGTQIKIQFKKDTVDQNHVLRETSLV